MSGRSIPYPDLPLPSKYRRITSEPEIQKPIEPKPKPPKVEAPKVEPRKPKIITHKPTSENIPSMVVLEPIIGGDLEPEAPRIRDVGKYVVEELSAADYDNAN